MDTVYYLPEADGRVRALLQPKDGIAPEGYLSADREDIPPLPEAKEGFSWCLYCTGSVFEWRAEEIAEAEALRAESVEAIKAQWPYPGEE